MTTIDRSADPLGAERREVQELATRGTEVGDRLEGLATALRTARGRLDDQLLDDVTATVDRAAGRLRLSVQHTVVAIAGATGSGKSSTYNALVGLELSSVGVRRPTTSWASACVWGSDGAEELLEWLGVPPRHQTMRDSMLDRHEERTFGGVVLLDLPDHDSTEVAHHLEVDRLVELADLLVWVLDPQKYADAALHDRYLAPYRTHADVMLVLVNQIDRIREADRQPLVDDVRRLLASDGLGDVRVIPISAQQGIGMDELRTEIEQRVAAKRSVSARVEADIAAAAARLDDNGGPRVLAADDVQRLEASVAEAAGVESVSATVGRRTGARAERAVAWPPLAFAGALLPGPAKRLSVDLGTDLQRLGGKGVESTPTTAPVSRELVDAAVRDLTDGVSDAMSSRWAEAIARAGSDAVEPTTAQLGAGLVAVDLEADRLPGWVRCVQALQWVIFGAAIAGGVWWLASVVRGVATSNRVLPLGLLVGGLLLGFVLWVLCRGAAARVARRRAEQVEDRLRGVITEAVGDGVVQPVSVELEAYGAFKAGLARARE